ncbi:cyclase family protein [Mycolicibacterium mageritense]|uniref:cyclase family protein n=1 Tax=Mycolicibacterium mageritense TaxID=53462 RepID=UPI0011D3EBBD|nr:cyclase family protein [Mycolicibacterium mageritense]TXI63969.1 MAG: cyclase family protein [Mycolicibacterium mageritense]
MTKHSLPRRQELKRRPGQLSGTSWGLFPDPWRGAPSFVNSDTVIDAVRSVTRGEVFGLDYPIDAFMPGMSKARKPARHVVYANHPAHRDDYLDGYYLQASTQVDGLRHRRADGAGFYGGVPDERITADTADLGIQVWADDPIVTRGLVVDLAGHLESTGTGVDHREGQALGYETIRETLAAQSVEPRRGDVIMFHTGWSEWFLGLPPSARLDQQASGRASGLAQSEELLDWAWDTGVALLAADNFAVECLPPLIDSPFAESAPHDKGMMHQEFLAKLGIPLGELWKLGPLARRMRELGRWESLLIVKPLNVIGGTGSPANATAIL